MESMADKAGMISHSRLLAVAIKTAHPSGHISMSSDNGTDLNIPLTGTPVRSETTDLFCFFLPLFQHLGCTYKPVSTEMMFVSACVPM